MSIYTEVICRRCLRAWIKHVETPKVCAFCKSPYWNQDRKGHGKVKLGDKRIIYPWPNMEVGDIEKIPLTRDNSAIGMDYRVNSRRINSLDSYIRRSGRRFHTWMEGLTLCVKRVY